MDGNEVKNEEYDYEVKLLLVGHSGAGKSTVLHRFVHGEFHGRLPATIGAYREVKMMEMYGQKIKLEIWDTNGQDKHLPIVLQYFRGATGTIFFYDITDEWGLGEVQEWIKQFKQLEPDKVTMLLGHKCDCIEGRVISNEQGEKIAYEYGMQFLEVSAKENINIDKAFQECVEILIEKDYGIIGKLKEAKLENLRLEKMLERIGKNQLKDGDYDSRLASDFVINGILGKGSFGVVFETLNIFDGFKYAVKRISVNSGGNTKQLSEILERTLREVRAMAELEHVGIIGYKNTWMEDPPDEWQINFDDELKLRFPSLDDVYYPSSTVFIYIQMQLCKYSLVHRLKREGIKGNSLMKRRDVSLMKSWFKQIVCAVSYIHGKGLIHRDLKPSNILFLDDNHLKICDMGIVTQMTLQDGEEVAATNTTIGTPLYMAPEQGSWQYDSKVDVFSLGLIFAEMCIIMTENQRKEIFHKLRYNLPLCMDELEEQSDGFAFLKFYSPRQMTCIEFIKWLTQADSGKRPTCNAILQHAFLS